MTVRGPAGGPADGEHDAEKLLAVAQVVAIMRLSRSAVYRLIEEGRLPAVRRGRALRVPEAAVDEYLRHTLPGDLA